jgi:cytochrome b involved in lipid metabolism
MSARDFFLLVTGLFWLAIGYYAVRCPQAASPPPTAAEAPGKSNRQISLAELATHDKAGEDCWMAINGKVYALHAFIDIHPSRGGLMEPWCGKDASRDWRVIAEGKQKGQPHSARAQELLDEYLVGTLSGR